MLIRQRRLAAIRKAEVTEAVGHLGMPVERLVFLGERDTKAPRNGAAFDRVTRHLAAWLMAFDCSTIFVPWRHDPHADHEAAALIGEAAARFTNVRLLAYPVWGWTLLPDSDGARSAGKWLAAGDRSALASQASRDRGP